MKKKLFLLLALVILAGGCIKIKGESVPILYAKVTMDEINGIMVIEDVQAYAGEIDKFDSPMDQYPKNFPAVYVDVIQNMTKKNYQTGIFYKGPGVYNFTVGIERAFNKSAPVAVTISAVNATGEYVDGQGMRFNWSFEKQSKKFK